MTSLTRSSAVFLLHQRPSTFATLVFAGLIGLSISTFAFAQQPPTRGLAAPPESTSPAADTPRLIPFIGEFEVWCTDRNPSNGFCSRHHGSPAIDIGMPVGTPLYAAGDGEVITAETGCGRSWCRGGAGNFVAIQHADGRISRYLHLDSTSVSVGQIVVAGDLIGLAGQSGQWTSPHLHYDEHAPAGTRSPFGEWLGCVDGEIVSYPEAVGFSDWNDVPFHTILRNDGYECFDAISHSPEAPVILPGFETAGVVLPKLYLSNGVFETEVERTANGETTTVYQDAEPGSVFFVDLEPATGYLIKIRVRSGESVSPWSMASSVVGTTEPVADTCFGLYATPDDVSSSRVLIGSRRPDQLTGSEFSDFVCGRGGDDRLVGLGGADQIDGGRGNDQIHGGTGDDQLLGRQGHDAIYGDDGNDTIVAGAGTDLINGGSGRDRARGGSGNDTIRGAGGNDHLSGGGGDDTILGGTGQDRLYGSAGSDSLDGGAGIDRCVDPDWKNARVLSNAGEPVPGCET